MEYLNALFYAGFGFLSYKIAGVFIKIPFVPIIIGIVSIFILFGLTNILNKFRKHKGNT